MNRSVTHAIAVLLTLLLTAAAFAGKPLDILLKDGSKWRGEVGQLVEVRFVSSQGPEVTFQGTLVKAGDMYVQVDGESAGKPARKVIFKSDIISMRTIGEGTDAAAEGGTTDAGTGEPGDSSGDADKPPAAPDPSLPAVFFLPLSGTVGIEFRHEEMEAVAAEADKYGDGQIIILEIHSGGGLATEMEEIDRVLSEIRQRHRLVAWTSQAISAACATAIHCPEIYFTTEGVAGSMTAFAGGVSLKGEELQQWLDAAARWMEEGNPNRPGQMGRVMIHAPLELSYDKDPQTGKITWYNDLSGEFDLSAAGDNLTFNSSNAVHCGFAQGIADTEEELAKLLQLPYWYETSDFGRKLAEKWKGTCKRAQKELPRLAARYQYEDTGTGDPVAILGNQIQIIERLIYWWNRCPNVARMQLPPKKTLERQLEQMKYELSQMRRRR